MSSSSPALRQILSARQLQLMALGSSISVGLFLGSSLMSLLLLAIIAPCYELTHRAAAQENASR